MRNFLDILKYSRILPGYVMMLILLTFTGYEFFNFGWYGLLFSIPIFLIIVSIDLFLSYKQYKKYKKNYGKNSRT